MPKWPEDDSASTAGARLKKGSEPPWAIPIGPWLSSWPLPTLTNTLCRHSARARSLCLCLARSAAASSGELELEPGVPFPRGASARSSFVPLQSRLEE
uniref:Uncharacterized protein n=1 Tax=Setaria viridis TaxID=4556 RepID=A0A4U6VHS4_SETVI|nr:hypothetical protein SEVIR_3G227466v2 [Setaria viridis]